MLPISNTIYFFTIGNDFEIDRGNSRLGVDALQYLTEGGKPGAVGRNGVHIEPGRVLVAANRPSMPPPAEADGARCGEMGKTIEIK